MRRATYLYRSTAYVVFGPTVLAYGWIVLGYVAAGLIVYAACMAVAYKLTLFDDLKEWPRVSQGALCCGPILIGLGCYFSTLETRYWMLIPMGVYGALGMIGSVAFL